MAPLSGITNFEWGLGLNNDGEALPEAVYQFTRHWHGEGQTQGICNSSLLAKSIAYWLAQVVKAFDHQSAGIAVPYHLVKVSGNYFKG